MDGSPINRFTGWLWTEAASITVTTQPMTQPSVDTSELRRMIAAGEYRLDAHAIAEAMFARADRDFAGASARSEVFEAGEGDRRPRRVE